MGHPLLQYLRNVQIAQFVFTVRTDEHIGCLEIPVQYFLIVQRFQTSGNLDKCLPNLIFLYSGPGFEVGVDQFHEVASLGELHDDAEVAGKVIVECLFEFDDVVVVEGGENTDLIECVFLLFLFHADHPHLLQGVDLVVQLPPHLVHLPERPLAHLLHYLEVLKTPFLALHYNNFYHRPISSFPLTATLHSIIEPGFFLTVYFTLVFLAILTEKCIELRKKK